MPTDGFTGVQSTEAFIKIYLVDPPLCDIPDSALYIAFPCHGLIQACIFPTIGHSMKVQNLYIHNSELQCWNSIPLDTVPRPDFVSLNSCTFCPHCIYVFCIYLRTNSDLCHLLYKLIGFYNRDERVYCAVRTGSLNKAVCASYLKG